MFQYLARKVLSTLGWSTSIDLRIKYLINKYDRIIIVYPHTSQWDFVFAILYSLIYHQIIRDAEHEVVILMKPQPFKYFGFILRYLGCIPAAKLESSGSGTLNMIKQHLSSKKKFIFLISPKGQRSKGQWHSSYFYLARELKSIIIPAGLDYCDLCIKSGAQLYPEYLDNIGRITSEIKYSLRDIIPLHPERSEIPLVSYSKQPSIMSTICRHVLEEVMYQITVCIVALVIWFIW